MRAKFLMAGLVVVLAACEKKAETPAADTTTAMAPAPAPTTGTGTTHQVNMVLEGSDYKFVPATLTIKAGDMVRFTDVSGGPHNVQFYADSIPAGAAAALDAGMPDKMTSLAGPMVETGGSYTVSFAGAPVGDYKYYCLPHQAMGMKAMITVQ
jgi:plastocyanin